MHTLKVRGVTITYWEDYHPWLDGLNRARFQSTPVSSQVLALKRGGVSAAQFFANGIRPHLATLPRELLLCHVPSHEAEQDSPGLQKVLEFIRRPGDQVSPVLIERTETIQKLATGGSRDAAVHEKSLKVGRFVTGRGVLILDDVVRSGNSLAVAAQMTIKAGAKAVYPLALTKSVP